MQLMHLNNELACDSYSVPYQVLPHIDFITPSVSFDAAPRPNFHKRGIDGSEQPARKIGEISSGPKKAGTLSEEEIIQNIVECGSQITPICLQVLYKLPPGTTQKAVSKNSYGIGEIYTEHFVYKS